jgi:oxygen-dependent protoporphyrinogen oxidase
LLDAHVTVFEASPWVGGRALTVRRNGFVFDVGALALLPTYSRTIQLLDELGLAGQLLQVTPALAIPRDGQLHRFDLAQPLRSFLGTRLVSSRSKLRLLKLLPTLARYWNRIDYVDMGAMAPLDAESCRAYCRRVLNDEIHDYLVDPMIRLNMLHTTDAAPIADFFWLLKQYAAPYLLEIVGGMNCLAEALSRPLDLRLSCRVDRVETVGSKVCVAMAGDSAFFDMAVVAVPPPDALVLVPELAPATRRCFEAIEALPAMTVHAGLRVAPEQREMAILPGERDCAPLLSIILDHNKSPDRAPPGKGVVTLCMRFDWARAHWSHPDAAIVAEAFALASPWLWIDPDAIEISHVQRWSYATARSAIGSYRRLGEIERDASTSQRIVLVGDWRATGIEAGVLSGEAGALELAKRWAPSTAER